MRERSWCSLVLLFFLLWHGLLSVRAGTLDEEGRWTLLAPLLTPRAGHTATVLASGQILVVGGASDNSGQNLTSVELYDPVTNRWSLAAPLSVPRLGHTATLLRDGRVLIAGGYTTYTAYASAEIYEPRSNTWASAGSLAEARSDYTATLLNDGRVLVAGGHSGGNIIQSTLASAEIYDPATNRWTPAGRLGDQRTYHASTVLNDGRVMITGGLPSRSDGPLASVEIYDPAANRWIASTPMLHARYDHTLVSLSGGTVLAFGGAGTERVSEVFDPRTNAWTVTGDTQSQHRKAAGLLLPGGVVLAIDIAPELYDPQTQDWAKIAPLNSPRIGAATVLLRSGQPVLIGGVALGSNGEGTLTGAMERYDSTEQLPGLPHTGSGGAVTKMATLNALIAGTAVVLLLVGCLVFKRRSPIGGLQK